MDVFCVQAFAGPLRFKIFWVYFGSQYSWALDVFIFFGCILVSRLFWALAALLIFGCVIVSRVSGPCRFVIF